MNWFPKSCLVTLILCGPVWGQGRGLQEQLASESSADLVKAARSEGDPQRGAVLFHQPVLACARCHATGQATVGSRLGPDLARPEAGTTGEFLVESILFPSKAIRKGFEPIVVHRSDGKTITGLLVSDTADKLILNDVARLGETISIPKSQIDEQTIGTASLMPAGQVNALASRSQFLDLARYLMEIAEGGPDRAKQLQPPSSLFAFTLPDYEKQIDHAGLLRDLDAKSFQRGEAIYHRLCINCHGTKDQPGSLPASLRFAEGQFKNGHDPFRMYQTLTHGFGLMTAQTWMVPQQKYDVIHYIREAYLKPFNPAQYARVDATYLESLPTGTTRGPAPSQVDPWSSMDYGPFLIATYEVGRDGSNFAHKGIATRLDAGPGGVARGNHWMVFDHDTLRVAAAWSRDQSAADQAMSSRFIDWQGINFDGRHQIHPRVVGRIQFANPTGPGWADPETGTFEDPRLVGRDNRRYGPLPREWGQYRGLYQHGEQLIVSYTVGQTPVLEMPGLSMVDVHSPASTPASAVPIFTRTFQIGPRPRSLSLKVATHPAGKRSRLETVVVAGEPGAPSGTIAMLIPAVQAADVAPVAIPFQEKTRIEISKSEDFDFTDQDLTIGARIKTTKGGTILAQAPVEGPWAPDGKTLFIRGGKLSFDIGWVGVVTGKSNVADGRWHDVALIWQHTTGQVRLLVDGKLDGQGTLKPKKRGQRQTMRLGFTSDDFPDPSGFQGEMADVWFLQQAWRDDNRMPDLQSIRPEDRRKFLKAHWKLGPTEKLDAATKIVRDETGNGHDGRVAGDLAATEVAESVIGAGLSPSVADASWSSDDSGSLILRLPAGEQTLKFVLSVAGGSAEDLAPEPRRALVSQPALELASLIQGGARRWRDELQTPLVTSEESGPFAVDILTVPVNNPWLAQLRLTGFDFFPDGDRMAICSWDGDVWVVSGIAESAGPATLRWRRIANGLFQPLGLKIVDSQIYVTCRDQIAVLRDLNGDGETDFVECFNNDHQVTEHFHEFAMGLQTDAAGNFYYAKSARHALPAVVPHHGTLLKVSRDGSSTAILANGFRAANGVCLNDDGTFIVTDQEGHWNPKNRINWVTPAGAGERPRFYGNLFGYHDVTDASDSAMQPPLCWITNAFDRSPAELLWVTSEKWGPLQGSLLNLSYGYGKVFVVPFEKIGSGPSAIRQGGLCELPLPTFPTGIMRGRFHPRDGQLYTCGMFAWAGNATQPGGLYRIRATGQPVHVPLGLAATQQGMTIRFSGDLDPKVANDKSRYVVRTWSLKRSADYGSKHYDEKTLNVAEATVASDGRTVTLELPEIQPTWCMSIEYKLAGSRGEPVNGLIHNTIHVLGN